MDVQNHITSEAEEMYLITVARAVEDGEGPPVALSSVARALDVSSVSANQMVKKLETLGLVTYTPYKGVSLTADGERRANAVLRSRRLWSVFLVEHLGLSADRADEVACEMEHVTPGEIADRLSSFLGDPLFGPKGKAIPAGVGGSVERAVRELGDVPTGSTVRIVEVDGSFASFLASQGIAEGVDVRVLAAGSDGSILLASDGRTVELVAEVASTLGVSL
ncbi:MAG TPA: metal-dependent transcriptional regulator [Acidimicrobiia bacterium]|nr:metal-dependent transcriptional regulator [Acidimicrobiia bacterium]